VAISLDRIDATPVISNKDLDSQMSPWLSTLVDTLNEIISDIEDGLNFLTAPNVGLLPETVTLTMGSPSFNVVDGSLYHVDNTVVGSGIPADTVILSIASNTITLNKNATSSGSSALIFVPGTSNITNGVLLYDTTTNKYVGMISGSLVQFTTTSYP
jgi:hypothetical protein